MPTKDDLLATAAAFAAHANNQRSGRDGFDDREQAEAAERHVRAAKVALEAAALASNTTESEIDQALRDMQDLLGGAGVIIDRALEMPTADFLRQSFGAMQSWRGEALAAQGYEVAYDQLRELLETLESDYLHGPESPVAQRRALLIRSRLDTATQTVNQAMGAADGNRNTGG